MPWGGLKRTRGGERLEKDRRFGHLDHLLERHEPFPAVVMDRHWNLLRTNRGAARFFASLIDLGKVAEPANILRLMFDPDGLRDAVEDWESVARSLVERVYREAVGGVPDETTLQLLDEILAYPGVPRRLRSPDLTTPSSPFVPVGFRSGDRRIRFFSVVTTLGTPQDITLQEIRIESFFPADEETKEHVGALAAD